MREKADAVLGTVLKALREESGITQEDLAYAAGITTSTLSRIERGQNSPRWATVVRIAEALDVPVGNLAARLQDP